MGEVELAYVDKLDGRLHDELPLLFLRRAPRGGGGRRGDGRGRRRLEGRAGVGRVGGRRQVHRIGAARPQALGGEGALQSGRRRRPLPDQALHLLQNASPRQITVVLRARLATTFVCIAPRKRGRLVKRRETRPRKVPHYGIAPVDG